MPICPNPNLQLMGVLMDGVSCAQPLVTRKTGREILNKRISLPPVLQTLDAYIQDLVRCGPPRSGALQSGDSTNLPTRVLFRNGLAMVAVSCCPLDDHLRDRSAIIIFFTRHNAAYLASLSTLCCTSATVRDMAGATVVTRSSG